MRAYKDLKPCARDQKAGEQSVALEICAGHRLTVTDGLVCVDGKATTEFFEQAEEVEDCNVSCSSISIGCVSSSMHGAFDINVLMCAPVFCSEVLLSLRVSAVPITGS